MWCWGIHGANLRFPRCTIYGDSSVYDRMLALHRQHVGKDQAKVYAIKYEADSPPNLEDERRGVLPLAHAALQRHIANLPFPFT